MKHIRLLLPTLILLFFLLNLNGCSNEESVEAEEESIPWSNGTYSGELSNALPHGHGIWTNSSGETYDGEWEYGVRHGYGKWTNTDGESYEGGWSENLKHGTGKYTWSDGSTYEGTWEYDIEQGFGKWTDADGSSYEGQFRDGLFHGEGLWLCAEGEKYEGFFISGKPHDEGLVAKTDENIDSDIQVEGIDKQEPATASTPPVAKDVEEPLETSNPTEYNTTIDDFTVKRLRFFESSDVNEPPGQRRYLTSFNNNQTRGIHIELELEIHDTSIDRRIAIQSRVSRNNPERPGGFIGKGHVSFIPSGNRTHYLTICSQLFRPPPDGYEVKIIEVFSGKVISRGSFTVY